MSADHNCSRERRAKADSNRGPSPTAYQPNALPLGQTGSQIRHCGRPIYVPKYSHTALWLFASRTENMTCGYSPVRTGIAARFTCRKRPETPGTANTPLFGGKEGGGGLCPSAILLSLCTSRKSRVCPRTV